MLLTKEQLFNNYVDTRTNKAKRMADYHLVVPMEVTTSRGVCRTTPQKVAKPQKGGSTARYTHRKSPSPQRATPGVTQIRRQEERTATQDTPTPQADQPTNKDGSTLRERSAKRFTSDYTTVS